MSDQEPTAHELVNGQSNHRPFPQRGSRKVRGATFDVTPENRERILNFPLATYACCALEVCPTTGNEHYQFYLTFKNTCRLSTLRANILSAGFYACDASHRQNILYVLKQRDKDYADHADDDDYDGNTATFMEKGERPDERAAASRTLDALLDCQNFLLATQHDMPDYLRQQAFEKVSDVTESLCHLLDQFSCGAPDGSDCEMSDSEEEDDNPAPFKKMKLI